MKYALILIALILLYYLWRIVTAIIERGLPVSPVSYITAVVGVIIAYIFYRIVKSKESTPKYELIAVTPLFILFVLSIAFHLLGIEILQQIKNDIYFWYLVSSLGLWGFMYFQRWRAQNKLKETKDDRVYASRVFVWLIILCAITAILTAQ